MPERVFDTTGGPAAPGPLARDEVYRTLLWGEPPADRPYLVANMVSTVDGKVVVGGAGSTRLIGSATDHFLMTQIERQVDAVLVGAGLVRDDDPGYPRLTDELLRRRTERGVRPEPWWVIVTSQAQFPGTPRLMQQTPDRVAICTTRLAPPERLDALRQRARVLVLGDDTVGATDLARALRRELGIQSVCCLGGPTLNGALFDAGCIDELFLTLAPKLKGSAAGATAVEGRGFAADRLLALDLVSLYRDGSELYLRYRVAR
jgi:riboflavin-specific deaminase-like protein